MHTVLPLDRQSAAIIGPRLQAPLYRLAKPDVFLLDFVAERQSLGRDRGIACRVEEPFENGKGSIVTQGQDDITAHVIRVDIEHEVGKDLVIERTAIGLGRCIAYAIGSISAQSVVMG